LTGVPSSNVFGFGGTDAEEVVGVWDVFVSCAKEDGARIQKTRRMLRHCLTIKFSVSEFPNLIPLWVRVNRIVSAIIVVAKKDSGEGQRAIEMAFARPLARAGRMGLL
jgi:hypothetical protein